MSSLYDQNEIIINRSDDTNIPINFFDENNNPKSIAGYTIFFTVKSKFDVSSDDSLALIKKDISSHIDAANGQSQILLSSTETNIEGGSYNYDIQTKDSLGNINTVVKGKFTVNNDITKRTA